MAAALEISLDAAKAVDLKNDTEEFWVENMFSLLQTGKHHGSGGTLLSNVAQ